MLCLDLKTGSGEPVPHEEVGMYFSAFLRELLNKRSPENGVRDSWQAHTINLLNPKTRK